VVRAVAGEKVEQGRESAPERGERPVAIMQGDRMSFIRTLFLSPDLQEVEEKRRENSSAKASAGSIPSLIEKQQRGRSGWSRKPGKRERIEKAG